MPSSFTDLPPEIQTQVVSLIQDPKTFIDFSLACKQTYQLLSDSFVSNKIFYRTPQSSTTLPDLVGLQHLWKGEYSSLTKSWQTSYQFYTGTEPMLRFLKELKEVGKCAMNAFSKPSRANSPVRVLHSGYKALIEFVKSQKIAEGILDENRINKFYDELGIQNEIKIYKTFVRSASVFSEREVVEKSAPIRDILNNLFIKVGRDFLRRKALKKLGHTDYRLAILLSSKLHRLLLHSTSKGVDSFTVNWVRKLKDCNDSKLLLTIFRESFIQEILGHYLYGLLPDLIGHRDDVVLEICTDPALQFIKAILFNDNDYSFSMHYAQRFHQVAQYVLSQPKFIQELNASQLQQICASHANFFKLFELPDINHEKKLYYLFMLQPEVAAALGPLEEEFKAYQQEPEIEIFLRQQGVTSFYHFLSQIAEYTTNSTFVFKASHPLYPKAVKFLDADFLNYMNLSGLANAEKREAVLEGEASLKTLVTNTPSTDHIDSQFMSLRLSP